MSVNLGSANGQLNLSAKGFVDGINTAITALEKLKTKSSDAAEEVKDFGEESNKAKSKIDSLGNEIKDTGNEAQVYDSKIDKAEDGTKKLGDEADKTKDKQKKLGDTLKTVGDKLTTYGDKLSKAGGTLTKYITLPATALATYSVKSFADFESSMSKVQATSNATADDMKKLSDKAKQMGETTKFSAKESADALNYMAMAGWKTDDMLSGLEGIMDLAAASGEDLANVSDIVTDALTAFGLSAKDSGKFADVLATASSNANTNVTMLGESFKYVAPVAGSLGYSVEDVAINLGLMANSGIKAGQAGTAMRAALSRLIKPTDDVKEMMDKLNISMTDQSGKTKSLGELTGDLRTAFSKLSESEQAQTAATLFGQEAMSGMLAVIRASDDDYNTLTKAINNSDGAAKKMSEIRMDNFSGQLTLLKSKAEGVGIQFGEVIVPYLGKFIDKISSVLTWFGKLDTKTKDLIVRGVALLAALGPILKIIGNITKAAGGLTKAFGLIAAHPVVAAVAALAAGIAALTIAMNESIDVIPKEYNAYQEFSDKVKEAAEQVKNLKDARKKTIDEGDAELNHYKTLKDELDTIVDKNGNIKKGYEDRAKFITTELSKALGIEIDNNGKVIKNYQDVAKQIDKTIEKRRQEMYLEAYKESYVNAIKKQKEAEENLYKASQHRLEQQRLLQEAEKKLAENQARGTQANKDARDAVEKYRDQLTKANQDWITAQNTYTEYARTINNWEALNTALITGDEKKINDAMQNLVHDFKTAGQATQVELQQQYKNFKEHYEFLVAEANRGNTAITSDMIKTAKDMADKAEKEMNKLEEYAKTAGPKAMTSYAEAMKSKESREALTNAFNYLSPFFGTEFSKLADKAANSFVTEWDIFVDLKAKTSGEKFVTGFSDGIIGEKSKQKVKSAVDKLHLDTSNRFFNPSFSSSGIFSNLAAAALSTDINGYLYSGNQSLSTAYSGASGYGYLPNQQNTFNFYSPEPIDEIEAANQIKKVQRQLAEGFM